MMIGEEIWLSDSVDEEEQCFLNSQDPSAFGLALTYQGGVAGGYHVRNGPGEFQRTTVSAFQGGSQKKPAFTVSCQAKVIIHGAMAGDYGKRATLLVYELNFLSRRGIRIKEANIRFEFKKGSERSVFPEVVVRTGFPESIYSLRLLEVVVRTGFPESIYSLRLLKGLAIRPDGVCKMGETLEASTTNEVLSFNLNPGLPGVDAGVTLSGEHSRAKETKHYTTIVCENQPDLDFGYHTQPRFMLEENSSQKTGIPSRFTVAALLERENDDDFIMIPYIEVSPSFKLSTFTSSISSVRSSDDPVIFNVTEPSFNQLNPSILIDKNNLGLVNMDRVWDRTMFNLYGEGIKRNATEEEGSTRH